MDGIKLPEFLNTEEKYNKLIRGIDTLQKFEELFLEILSDDELEMSSILTLMKVIERDVILVNKLTEATTLLEMTESFLRYMMMKDIESNKKKTEKTEKEDEPDTKSFNKTAENISKNRKKFPKNDSKNQKKKKSTTATDIEGEWTCDCPQSDQ